MDNKGLPASPGDCEYFEGRTESGAGLHTGTFGPRTPATPTKAKV